MPAKRLVPGPVPEAVAGVQREPSQDGGRSSGRANFARSQRRRTGADSANDGAGGNGPDRAAGRSFTYSVIGDIPYGPEQLAKFPAGARNPRAAFGKRPTGEDPHHGNPPAVDFTLI